MKFARRRWVFLGLGVLGALVILPMLIVGAFYLALVMRGRADLAKEVKFVRERGWPLSTLELNDYYRPAAGKIDVTAEFERLTASCDIEEVVEMAKSLPDLDNGEQHPPPEEARDRLSEVEAFLAKRAELLAFLQSLPARNATTRFTCDLSPVPGNSLPCLDQLVYCMRLLSLQCRIDIYHGRSRAAVDRIIQQLALAEITDNIPDMVIQLTRTILVKTALKDLAYAIEHGNVPDESLIQLQLRLTRFDARATLAALLKGDRAFSYSMCAMPVDALAEYEHELSQDEVSRRILRGPTRSWDAALLMSYYRRIDIACDDSLISVHRQDEQFVPELRSLIKSSQMPLYPYTCVMAPMISPPCSAFVKADARSRSAIAALASLRFRRAQGRWPNDSSELIPTYLEQAPIDAFTGEPLRFRAEIDSFKVYGLGENGVDDGGSWNDDEWLDEGFAVKWRES